MTQSESFVGEPITPKPGTFDSAAMATGAPGLPRVFTCRGREYTVAAVIESWKTTGPCRSGSPEAYVHKHWYRVRTATGETMTLYFDRQPPRGRARSKARWFLYTMTASAAGPTSDPAPT